MTRFFDNLTFKGFAAPLAASVLMAGVAAGSMSATGTALAAEPDFTGKKITFLTPHRGADSVLSLKTWMKYASKNLKGNPEITVQSKFGGGGVTAANFFQATAKPDGLTASMLNLPAFISYSVGRKGVKYDISTMKVIAGEAAVYVHIAGKSAKAQDASGVNASAGEQSFGTRSRNFNVMTAQILWRAAGSPVRVVTGFRGNDTVIQALASGELNLGYIYMQAWMRNLKNYADLNIKPIYQMGTLDAAGNIMRDPLIKDVPTADELYLKLKPNAKGTQDYKALRTAMSMYQIAKGFFLPAGTDAAIVNAWRTAVDKGAKDPAFIAEHTKLFGFPLAYVPWAQASKNLNDGLATLKEPYFQPGGEGYQLIIGTRQKKKK